MEAAINHRQLRYFVKVVEIGSFTAAAEQLNVAQPALGLQIRNLEEDLGVPLLLRHSRGVEATPAGELLHKRAIAILESIEAARQEIINFAGHQREVIRFGITPSAMSLLGPDIVLDAREAMPDVFLSLVEELSFALAAALEAGELDAAFTYQRSSRPNLTQRALIEEELLFVSAPEAGLPGGPITFREVARHDLVLAGERDIVRQIVEETAGRLSVAIKVLYESQSIPATRNLVQKGIASTVIPFGSVAEQIASGELHARRIVEPSLRRTLFFVQRTHRSPLQDSEAFNAFLSKVLHALTTRLGDLCHPLASLDFPPAG